MAAETRTTTARVVMVQDDLVTIEAIETENGYAKLMKNEMVYVCPHGTDEKLKAEVLRVRGRTADAQVYEETRGVAIGDGVEHVVIDGDQFGGVERLLQRFGDHQSDIVADIAHDIGHQRIARRRRQQRRLRQRRQLAERHRAEAVLFDQLLAGIDGENAGRRRRGRGIQRRDARTRVRRAHEHRVRQAGEGQIVEIAAAAGQQAPVFPPRQRAAAAELHHFSGNGIAHRYGPDFRPRPIRRRPSGGGRWRFSR